MSGKGKQPRVKGNLKPTSSSRAADLLGGDMSAINAFKANPALAFSQFSRTTASASPMSGTASPMAQKLSSKASTPESRSGSATPAMAAIDQIDGVLASQLKRLGKHDSKTKMRALFELKSYVSEHTWENGLEGMLLAWPPLFKRHIFDPDRRVRAAVATVHAALVTKTGKRLAAHLKQLIGPWVASYFDPHREVGRSSRIAFEKVFPESKRAEVYAYCLGELIEFATDNIVNQTPETLSDPRFVDAEDMRSKYEHVIGVSFGTLGLVAEEAAPQKLLEHQAQLDTVFGNKVALKFLSDQSSFIRRGCYRLVRIIMMRCPEAVRDTHAVLAQALLANCFSDSDPNAHGDMWDAVLLTTKNYPQVWGEDGSAEAKKAGKKKTATDRLFEFLRLRCRLAPTISYPSILALLANLPAGILDEPSFQTDFNNALWQGAVTADDSGDLKTAAAARLDGTVGSRAAHQESVALVSAICECFSFLWTRSLKNAASNGNGDAGSSVRELVSKDVSRETDRLWHFYLQNIESADDLAQPVAKLYCKIESLSVKYDPSLLANIWAQTSWFAQRRLAGDAIYPVVYLVAQLASLDKASHRELAGCARKLLVSFCQHAVQSPDTATAQSLIQTLSQLAPDTVFQEGFSTKFSMRLEGTGSSNEAVDLVLSKAQYLIETTGSAADAAQSIDSFIASTLSRVGTSAEATESAFRLVTALLAALPGSEVAKGEQWKQSAQLPSLGRVLLSVLPQLPTGTKEVLSSAVGAPSLDLVRLLGQALLVHFTSEAELIDQRVVDSVFSWMEGVFVVLYEIQWTRGNVAVNSCLSGWTSATHEVLSSWTTLARDSTAGPRFVRFWLGRSGSQAHSALGLLFDFAISTQGSSDAKTDVIATVVSKLHPQAKRAWSATESQLEKLRLGSELSRALSDSISSDLGDLRVAKNPSHLARLANSVYTRICPQSDPRALQSLVFDWILDERQWARALDADSEASLGCNGKTDRYLGLASAAGASGLRQSVDDFGGISNSKSFHTLAHWSANAATAPRSVEPRGKLQVYDVFGLSRFARRAMFAIDFVQLSGGLPTLSFADSESLAAFVRHMALAFVLFREALLLSSNLSDDDEHDDELATSGTSRRKLACLSIIGVNADNSMLCTRVDASAKSIQELVSDLLSLVAVQGSSLPQVSELADSSSVSGTKAPRDPGRWLSTLVTYAVSRSGDLEPESAWERVAAFCVSKGQEDAGSPWTLVLGMLVEWCQWSSPLEPADIEAAVANPLSRRMSAVPEATPWAVLAVVIVRAVSLRQQCVQSPAMQNALLDTVSQLRNSADLQQQVALMELLCELLPSQKASLDAGTSTPKIVGILTALPEKIAEDRYVAAAGAHAALPVILAALATIQRFACCVPALDGASAVGLARLCLRWVTMDVGSSDGGTALQDTLLVAASRAIGALARAASALVEDSLSIVGPVMRQIGEQLVDTCVLSERPVPEGVYAVTQLVRCEYSEVPEFGRLYPVLASATPRLVVEMLRLTLSAPATNEYIGAHLNDLVRLVVVAAKALADLSVPLEEFGEAVESDEYIRSAGLRLLSSLLLVARCADGMAADAQKYEELSDLLSRQQVLDGAMPWVCGLLGLGSSVSGAFNAKLWDASASVDWETWAAELSLNPTGEHLFRVLAHHVLYSVAWAFPSTFRLWWAGLSQGSRATSVAVEQFVTRHISPTIVENEISRIRQQGGEDAGQEHVCDHEDECDPRLHAAKPTAIAQMLEEYDDSAVRAGATQATLSYTVDDSTLEIVVRLPPAYPLALPVFDSVKRVAVSEKRWRGWLVSAQAQMARNRRVDTVCAQLLGNIGAHFAGVEDCAICYSAVGTMDNTLPNKQCKTCKNKFHRMCLFKWFNTSNQSTCPLCRNLF